MEGLLPGELRQVIEELAIKHQKLAVEPTIEKVSGQIISEQDGIIVDIEKTVDVVLAAQENQKLDLVTIKIHPRYSANDLKKVQKVWGSYSTWISGTYQRHNNISLASVSINNTVIWPGETFSFNEIVGPRTVERGYLPAPVILMGSMGQGYGGGVCQVSSTVYNAALMADLKIVERHPHSKPVHYVPLGRDATVQYGALDLKFINNYNSPLIIKSGVNNGKLWVEILGEGKN